MYAEFHKYHKDSILSSWALLSFSIFLNRCLFKIRGWGGLAEKYALRFWVPMAQERDYLYLIYLKLMKIYEWNPIGVWFAIRMIDGAQQLEKVIKYRRYINKCREMYGEELIFFMPDTNVCKDGALENTFSFPNSTLQHVILIKTNPFRVHSKQNFAIFLRFAFISRVFATWMRY